MYVNFNFPFYSSPSPVPLDNHKFFYNNFHFSLANLSYTDLIIGPLKNLEEKLFFPCTFYFLMLFSFLKCFKPFNFHE